jgi:hypothetical protein
MINYSCNLKLVWLSPNLKKSSKSFVSPSLRCSSIPGFWCLSELTQTLFIDLVDGVGYLVVELVGGVVGGVVNIALHFGSQLEVLQDSHLWVGFGAGNGLVNPPDFPKHEVLLSVALCELERRLCALDVDLVESFGWIDNIGG